MNQYHPVADGEGELNFSAWVAASILSLVTAALCGLAGNWSVACISLINTVIAVLNAIYPRRGTRWVYWVKAVLFCAAVVVAIIAAVRLAHESAV